MVEVKSPSRELVETVVGKNVIDNIETIQSAVSEVLKDNKDLRRIENRHIVKLLVEQKLGRQVADESVPRACRHLQNSKGLWKPEVEDNRNELEEINHGYYSHHKK